MGNIQSKKTTHHPMEMEEFYREAILKDGFDVALPPSPFSFFVKKQFNKETNMWSISFSYQSENDDSPQPFYSFVSRNDFANVKAWYDVEKLSISETTVHINKISFIFDNGTQNKKIIEVVPANKSCLPRQYNISELSVNS